MKTEIDTLKYFGYVVLKNVYKIEELRKARSNLELLLRKSKNIWYPEKKDQTIIKSCFIDQPKFFLSLLEKPKIKKILNKIFDDGFTLQSMNASLAKPIRKKSFNLKKKVHVDSKILTPSFRNTITVGLAIPIDNFTEKNGATKVWPFSHKSEVGPKDFLKYPKIKFPEPINCCLNKGEALIFLPNLWHSNGPNFTKKNRWAIFTFFNQWWIKPTWDFTKCGENFFNQLTEYQKKLLGFTYREPSMYSNKN